MEKSNYHSTNWENKQSTTIIKSFGNTILVDKLAREWFLLGLDTCLDALAIYHHTLVVPTSENESRDNRSQRNADRLEMFCKLERDSMYVRQLLESVKSEMTEVGSYNGLINVIEENEGRKVEENNIMMNYLESQKTVEYLKKTVDNEMAENEKEIEHLKAQLFHCKEVNQEVESKIQRETIYTTAWEKTQCEQTTLQSNIILRALKINLDDCVSRTKNEEKIGSEIETFLNQNIVFNIKSSEDWEERYNREMLMYTEKNNQLRETIENRRSALQQLEDKFRERQAFIDKYLAEKEAARLERELEEHRRLSAILIQAWWRGVMVRRKLGPYRPDEKKKKKPPKGKK